MNNPAFSEQHALMRRYLGTERAAEDYCNEVVDGEGRLLYLDKVGSVSALVEVEDDFDYDPTHNELNELSTVS